MNRSPDVDVVLAVLDTVERLDRQRPVALYPAACAPVLAAAIPAVRVRGEVRRPAHAKPPRRARWRRDGAPRRG